MPTDHSLAPLADVPDSQRRDGGPELVIGCKDAVIPMPVPLRRRHEICEPVKKLTRREFDHAISSWPRGLSRAARADPVGGLVSGEHVADFGCAAARVTINREPLQREGRAGAIPQKVLQALKIARHVAVYERDPHARIDGKTAVLNF
jgi:hypothetical protein